MAAAPALSLSAPRPLGRGPRPRVCVVDDDGAVLVSLKFLFTAADFEVRAFASGRGLLASPALRVADGFVLDNRPRGLEGLALAQRLRKLGVAAPIVVTTGFRNSALESAAGGVAGLIVAPRVDEALIGDLLRLIEEMRGVGLRKTT